MDFLGVGPGELLVIIIIALIVLGPRRLPEIAQQVGKALGDLQRASAGIKDEWNRELSLAAREEKSLPPASPAPSVEEGSAEEDSADEEAAVPSGELPPPP